MVGGIDRWLMRETERVAKARTTDVSWPGGKWGETQRRLRERLGAVDGGAAAQPEIFPVTGRPANGSKYWAKVVHWPVFEGVYGQGVLYEPSEPSGISVILLNDAETPVLSAEKFAQAGCKVLVPVLVGRDNSGVANPRIRRVTPLSGREWIYRQGFDLGRTIIGYEVQSVLAAIPLIADGETKLGIAGHGEGALIAMHAAALESRFSSVLISGHFGPRERLWEEPIYRNVFGLLRDFGDAELAGLSAAKTYVVEHSPASKFPAIVPRGIEAPGKLEVPALAAVEAEIKRSHPLRLDGPGRTPIRIVKGADGSPVAPGSDEAVNLFFQGLGGTAKIEASREDQTIWEGVTGLDQRRIVRELGAYTQLVLRESERARYRQPLWTQLKSGAEYDEVRKAARAEFWEKVMGKISTDYLPPNPRSRHIYDKENWRGYEVMLDVHPDIFAWGILLVPKDLKPGERRPVVVCQHGLEGLPEDTITEDPAAPAWKYYKGFAARLCERGFIVYAPHNPYRGGDNFRVLQRKANPLGLSLFSFIIAQHDVTTRWLASLPFVDPERIGFYGLSYGGKTAMRVPAVLDRYCLSICSADFNEWVLKNASTEHTFSYVFTKEYEIFEWNLGHTFNYAEMALLIAPRPFMVERGHDDGVGTSEHVGYEFAKVRRGYDKLGIGERAEIEWFDGPHTINGVGTFKFLHRWLRWPER
jgi:cephalosporin-C deacetylase-like acetyl esterase